MGYKLNNQNIFQRGKRYLERGSFVLKIFWILCLFLSFSIPSYAESEGMGVSSSIFYSDSGWAEWQRDNIEMTKFGSYPSAVKLGLYGQKRNLSGTILYQVNSSGKGWCGWVENGRETGAADIGAMPLEAIQVKLNGQLEKEYDIYTKVLQNGIWTDWVKNGEVAGTSGVGTHIDGIRISLMKKGAGLPPELPKIDPNRPMVALTYDDGPAIYTPRILTALEKYGAKATFFVVGSNVNGRNIQTMQRALALGCEIGNHSWSHPELPKQSISTIRSQIDSTTTAIVQATGVQPRLFRPPYGSYNQNVLNHLGNNGYAAILWSIDTLDWKTKSASATTSKILNNVKDGDIILMHDIQGSSAVASETIIPELLKRGYQLVTISEMANARGGMRAGSVYHSFRK